MNDYSRVNLVTRFKCGKCGSQLSLTYNKPKAQLDYVRDGITGADKVEVDIYIKPCDVCVDEPMKQLNTLRRILKAQDE